MTIKQILYVSKAAANDYDKMVDDIVTKAEIFNLSEKITGLLLFQSGFFMQLIEGPEIQVTDLFKRIKHDPRHKHIFEIITADTEERLFPNWSMGKKDLSQSNINLGQEIARWNETILKRRGKSNESIAQILERFSEIC